MGSKLVPLRKEKKKKQQRRGTSDLSKKAVDLPLLKVMNVPEHVEISDRRLTEDRGGC